MKRITLITIATLLASLFAPETHAQGALFTYQGFLRDTNGPVTNAVLIQFRIYAGSVGGVPLWTETHNPVPVSNGLFSVTLGRINPADETIFSGNARWLGISINGAAELTPRTQFTSTPYAITAGHLTGVLPSNALNGTYSSPVNFNHLANSFTGNGLGLTLNASRLTTGTVPDARLSSNVALRNAPNTFSGNQAIVSGNLSVDGQIALSGGSPATGKVLTSDSVGGANWRSPRSNPRTVTVDATGNGDFLTITAALNAINPSASNPFVIEVYPGTYVESISLKSHVHLKGAGRDCTFIQANPVGATSDPERSAIRLDNLANVIISGFTFSPNAAFTDQTAVAIYDDASSPTITENIFREFAGVLRSDVDGAVGGVMSLDSAPIITGNVFTNVTKPSAGIRLRRSSGMIADNQFGRFQLYDKFAIVQEQPSSTRIVGNRFSNQGGIKLKPGCSATIANNRFDYGFKAIWNFRSQIEVIGNHFDGYGEEGVFNDQGTGKIVANTFTNTSRAIDQTGGEATLISANHFQSGSHVWVENSSPLITGNHFDLYDIRVISGSPVIMGNGTTFGEPSVSMGTDTSANGFALAAGRGAKADHKGTFVWADSQARDFASTATNQFLIRASGGMGINVAQPRGDLHVGHSSNAAPINVAAQTIIIDNAAENGRAAFLALAGAGGTIATNRVEVQLEANESQRSAIIGTASNHEVQFRQSNLTRMRLAANGNIGVNITTPTEQLHVGGNILATGTITPNSDRRAKTDLKPVDTAAILERVAQLPIQQWRFKAESDHVKHVGPMAQDFHAAFGLGSHETAIATVDADGVALAAIQGLHQIVKEKDAELQSLKQRLTHLEKIIRSTTQPKPAHEN